MNTKLIRREVQSARNVTSESVWGIGILIALMILGAVLMALHNIFVFINDALTGAF